MFKETELGWEKKLEAGERLSDGSFQTGEGGQESASGEYEFFPEPEERKDIFEYGKSLSEYLKSQSVSDLVLLDRSARPIYIGVMEYWHSKYPNEKMPNIYFMNPKGFKAEGELTEQQIEDLSIISMFKDDDYESKKLRPKEEIEEEFQKTYRNLFEDKNKQVLIFDTCSHSGDSILPVKEMFAKSGFENIKVGTINEPDKSSKVKADFYINKNDSGKNSCNPFLNDLMIKKTYEHVYSGVSDNLEERKAAGQIRREIKKIMKEALKDEGLLKKE